LLVLVLTMVCPANAADDPLFRTLAVDDAAGLEVGRGLDILSGNPRADCVDRSVTADHAQFGPDVLFQSREISDNEQLNQELGVSASATFGGGFGSASASASFARSLNVESYSLSYVVSVMLSAKGPAIRDVKLKPQYLTLLRAGTLESVERFRKLCGDGYIGEFIVGGEFKSVVQIHTKSRAERESLSGSVSGSMSMASGGASFTNSVTKISKTNDVKILTYRRGGAGVPVAITPDTIAQQASALPEIVKSSSVPLRMSIFSYLTLIDDPTIPIQTLDDRETHIRAFRTLYLAARDRDAEISYILTHGDEFYTKESDIPILVLELNKLKTFETALQDAALGCVQRPESCPDTTPILPDQTVRPGRR
jgi:hypothetical protein